MRADNHSSARLRAWARLRAAQAGFRRDATALTVAQLVGRRLTQFSLGSLPRFRRRGAADLVGWVACAHKMGFSGLIASRYDLAQLLQVSASTAQRATAELAAAGWVVLRPRTAAWRLSDGPWAHRERAAALEPGPQLVAALAAAARPRRSAPAPTLTAVSSDILSVREQAEFFRAYLERGKTLA